MVDSDATTAPVASDAASVGRLLADARESAGLTIDDVSARTRLRATVVRAMENDDFAPCGGTVYARGHVRSIATAVGMDPAAAVAAFDRDHADRPVVLHDALPEVTAPDERRGPNWWAAAAVAMAIVTVLAAASLLRNDETTTPTDVAAGRSPAVATTAPAAPGPATSNKPPAPVAAAGVSLQLRITGVKSWVSITSSDRRKLYEGQLTTGQVLNFTDPRELRIILGNAGAVRLVVNGRDLGLAGTLGEVKRATFVPGDPTRG